jgi:chaperonin GroEL
MIEKTDSDYDREKCRRVLLVSSVVSLLSRSVLQQKSRWKNSSSVSKMHSTLLVLQSKKVSSLVVASLSSRLQKSSKISKLQIADQQIGVEIVKRALHYPTKKIAENAGQEGAVIVENSRNMLILAWIRRCEKCI